MANDEYEEIEVDNEEYSLFAIKDFNEEEFAKFLHDRTVNVAWIKSV